MGTQVTLGGDRIGSGNKIKMKMHNYERASFNVSRVWRSSITQGVVYPCFVDWATNGTTYEMKINEMIRTIPTVGPAFCSLKFQVEVYVWPLRLGQGMLHNNALKLGLNAKQVLLPKAEVPIAKYAEIMNSPYARYGLKHGNFGTSSLYNYLGCQSYGQNGTNLDATVQLDACTMLCYYDIIKNYHVNKQEENAYVIGSNTQYGLGGWMEYGVVSQGIIERSEKLGALLPKGTEGLIVPMQKKDGTGYPFSNGTFITLNLPVKKKYRI